MKTAVYVGAGIDIIPILLFRDIKTFIYIDSQPATEFGSSLLYPGYERPRFPGLLLNTMKRLGYVACKQSTNKNLQEFVNLASGTEIFYYMNNCFPHKLDAGCVEAISKASTLICCGYTPHQSIITMMRRGPLVFIGNNNTVYRQDEDLARDGNFLIDTLHKNPKLFDEYIRFDIPTGYESWIDYYIEKPHVVNFKVTKYLSLQELYNSRLR